MLARGWRAWHEGFEARRRWESAAARWRSCGLSLSQREGRKDAIAEMDLIAESKRKEAEEALTALRQQAQAAERSLADTDAHNAGVRRRLEDALAHAAKEGGGHEVEAS